MMNIPAHKSGTAGQIVNPIPKPVDFEKPLETHIRDYAAETRLTALQQAFDKGLRAGYLEGYEAARRRFVPQQGTNYVLEDKKRYQQLNPSSEESR